MADWISAIFNPVGSILRGWGTAESKRQQYQANAAEAEYQIDSLNDQLDRLLVEFNENQQSLETSLGNSLREGSQGVRTTQMAQSTALATAGQSNAASQAQLYAQLAGVQRQGMLSVGSAVMGAATSGFRNTGSVSSTIEYQKREAERNYDLTAGQIMLSSYQSYMQAASDYFSANVQIESYRESMRNAEKDFSLKSSALQSLYDYNKARTEAEKEYWQGVYDSNSDAADSGWQYFLDFIGGF